MLEFQSKKVGDAKIPPRPRPTTPLTDWLTKRITEVAPPGFCNREEVRYGSIGGLEYEVSQSRLYCLCINVALCSTALQCICRVITKKFHDNESTQILHNFWTSTHRAGGSFPLTPLAAPLDYSLKTFRVNRVNGYS